MRRPILFLAILLVIRPAQADIKFNVSHTDATAGWMDPTLGKARRDTLQAVFAYLNTVLDENGEADYLTNASDYNETGPIASAPTAFLSAPNGFSSGNVFLHARSGVDPNPGSADGTITVDWGYDLSPGLGTPPNGQLDLYSILLHEVTHSLGFLTRIRSDARSAVTNTDPGVYTVMDSMDRIGNTADAKPLFSAGGDFIATVADLSDFSPGIYYWGAGALAANSGKPLRLTQTNPHGLGSGLSHTGLLMASTISANDVKRTYSVRDLGMLRDFGWKLKPQNPSFLGPKKVSMLNDPAPSTTRRSNDVNEGQGEGTRFRGTLGGIPVHGLEGPRRPIYQEAASTAASSSRESKDAFTQINHRRAPGAILLQNYDGSHSPTGLTWLSPSENFRVPTRADEKFVLSFRARLDPQIDEFAAGTFLDAVVGASAQQIPGGAAGSDGIGIRLNANGPFAGTWQLFDGTGGAPVQEAMGPLARATTGTGSPWYRVSIELLEPYFDDATPTTIRVFIDDALVHTFTTSGAIGENFISFHAGRAATRRGEPAAYLLDDVEVALEPWTDAPPVVTVASSDAQGLVGTPFAAQFTASGGTGPYEWWLDGTLPAGLAFQDGAITGTPLESGRFAVTVSAVDYGFFVGKAATEIVIDGPARRRAVTPR